MLGRTNALQTVLFAGWQILLDQHFANPVDAIEKMRRTWLATADAPSRKFPGANPAHLDAVSQEYKVAIDQLSAELLRIAQGLAKEDPERR
jgi:hypothetical protein